jgi:hypothetical protein
MIPISIDSLISSGCSHLAVACLFAFGLLSWLDARRLAVLPKMILAIAALGVTLRTAFYSVKYSEMVAWIVCFSVVAAALLVTVKQWISTTPNQLHDEAQQVNAKKSKLRKEGSNSKTSAGLFNRLMAFLPFLVSLGCLLIVKQPEYWSLKYPLRYFAALEVISVTLMLGVALFLCFELTLISTPDALNATNPAARVSWKSLSRLTMVVALVILACCLAQFLQKPSEANIGDDDKIVQIAARLFGLILLIATFVVWIIPHRLAFFQRTNAVPKDWVSLTLAAWLGAFAFLVVATLPATWPWRILIN